MFRSPLWPYKFRALKINHLQFLPKPSYLGLSICQFHWQMLATFCSFHAWRTTGWLCRGRRMGKKMKTIPFFREFYDSLRKCGNKHRITFSILHITELNTSTLFIESKYYTTIWKTIHWSKISSLSYSAVIFKSLIQQFVDMLFSR